MTRITVLVADDHPLMRDGIAGLFVGTEFDVIAQVNDGTAALEAIKAHQPTVAVLDINMPGHSGVDLLRMARAEGWETLIVLLTAGIDAELLDEAFRLGADGLVLKDSAGDMLLRAVRGAIEGEPWFDKSAMQQVIAHLGSMPPAGPALTTRENDVARLVSNGRRNKEIAHELGISEGTVKMHLHNLYQKLEIGSRTELVILARDRGFDRA
ncbi:DNA-binding response regulator [Sphingomonas antarctica]|uniref:response regulator n=1 Tax=Sphingomonas antarctica TaxID=2040274 RepID=UPI0039E83E62